MKLSIKHLLFILPLFLFANGYSQSKETRLMVRAKAKDAKFIGSSIGGAKVIIRDAETNEILDTGFTGGSTGDTDLIMKESMQRGKQLASESTAGYEAVLQLEDPQFVTVEVLAPVNKKQALVASKTQLWLIPGKHIVGDGLVIEVPGFIIDIIAPQTHERIKAGGEIEIKANVVMMCGCPVASGGIWDSDQYEIKALIKKDTEFFTEIALSSEKKSSTFSAEINLEKGLYEITVYAYDPLTGNTGVDKTNIIIN